MGDCPVGECPVGECPVGECPVGECPVGECPCTGDMQGPLVVFEAGRPVPFHFLSLQVVIRRCSLVQLLYALSLLGVLISHQRLS